MSESNGRHRDNSRENPTQSEAGASTNESARFQFRDQRVSLVKNGQLVETVVSDDGYFQFAIAGESAPVNSIEDGKAQILPPYNLRAMWETGLVRFPSCADFCGSTGQLVEELERFIACYANVPHDWLEIIALYVLMTWVYDRFTAVPYLRFMGEPGTGKTRLLHICVSVSYKGMALFRTIDLIRGTMAVDEADFKSSEEWSDITKVLNNGYTTGAPVVRCERLGTDFTPHAMHVYGPKIISTRLRFSDEALESRCLTLETREEQLPAHIPLQLPHTFEREARALRNKLLTWRFGNFFRIQAREDEMRSLSPRTGQIGASLAAVAPSVESRARLVNFLSNYDASRREDGPKGMVLQGLNKLRESGSLGATVGDVAKAVNDISESLGCDWLSAKRVGGILRSLGFTPRRTKEGYVVDLSAAGGTCRRGVNV